MTREIETVARRFGMRVRDVTDLNANQMEALDMWLVSMRKANAQRESGAKIIPAVDVRVILREAIREAARTRRRIEL